MTDFSGGANQQSRDPLSAVIDQANDVILLTVVETDTLSEIEAELETATYTDIDGTSRTLAGARVTITGAGTSTLDASTYFDGEVGDRTHEDFSGGLDAEPLEAAPDYTDKEFLVRYDTVADDLDEIEDIINETSIILASLIKGSSAAGTPESPGFERVFRGSGGSSALGTGGTGANIVTSTSTRSGRDFTGSVDAETERAAGMAVFVRWSAGASGHAADPRFRLHTSDSYANIVDLNGQNLETGQLRNNSHGFLLWQATVSRWVLVNPALTSAMLTASSPATNQFGMLSPGDIDSLVQGKIDDVVDSAPGALDTLNELAAALGDDADFATTMTNMLAGKLATDLSNVAGTVSSSDATTFRDRIDAVSQAELDEKADIDDPDFTGTPTVPDLTAGSADGEIVNKGSMDDALGLPRLTSDDPDFTGTPTVPDLTAGSADGQIVNKGSLDDAN